MTDNILLPTMIDMDVGTRIRRRREEIGLTQAYIAKEMRVSRAAVSQWEKNKTAPMGKRREKLAELLKMSVGEMLLGDPTKRLRSAEIKLLDDWNTLPSKLQQDYATRIHIIATALRQTLPGELSFDTIPPRRRSTDKT